MFKIKDFLGSGLKSLGGGKGKSEKESGSSLASKLSVNEEYKEAFRTNSYLEIRAKVEGEFGQRFSNRLSSSSSLSALSFHIRLNDCLLEPQQETLSALMEESNFHRLLIKFFEFISESCNICESLLQSVHQTRVYHRKIKRVIKIGTRVLNDCGDNYPEKIRHMMFQELSRFAALKNPLSIIREEKFLKVHDSKVILLKRISSKQKRIRRKAKIYWFCKKMGASGLVISHTAIVVALLIIGLHSIVGILAAPVLLGCFPFGLELKKIKGKCIKTKMLETLGAQLDIAAKGMFILINDFDTMSRLAERLYDEIEHRKTVAAMCVKSGKIEVLNAAVKEFRVHEQRFLDQLLELEEHVYLCLHTMNRSRRLVLEQITGSPKSCNS